VSYTDTYTADGVTCRVYYTTSTTNTTLTITAKLQYYLDWPYDEMRVAPIRSDTLKMSVSGSVVASKSSSYSSSEVISGGGWSGIGPTVSKTYTLDHSTHSYSLSFSISFSTSSSHSATRFGDTITVPKRTSYTVTYNANGGSSAPSSQTKWYDETLTLTTSKPYRTNYVFWHWNTNSSNSGTTYSSGGSYSGNAALTLYAIWNPVISYNANGGTNAPASQIKTYGQSLTLSSTVPTRFGYEFMGWGTSSSSTTASYQPGGTYTSNSATTLYAIWRKIAEPPMISSMSVVRCDSSGMQDDGGTYAKLTAYWTADTTSPGMAENEAVITGTIMVDGDSSTSRSITFSSGASGTSGTAAALIDNCDTDNQYIVTIVATNTKIGAGQSSILSSTRTDILTRAFFTMDFAAGGKGVGIGTAAPHEGFECGFDAQFDGDVEILGDMTAANLTVTEEDTTANVATAYGTFVVDSASAVRYGPIVMVNLTIKTGESLSSGTDYRMASLASAYRPPKWLGIGTDYGGGEITDQGNIYLRPSISVNSNVNIRVSAIFIRG